MSLERFKPSSSVSGWMDTGVTLNYEPLTYITSANLSITGNGTGNVSIFKTSGSFDWNNQAYSSTPFTAPCTIEFNKWSAYNDNGRAQMMIGWNTDPTTDAGYASIDYASYPLLTSAYYTYNSGTGTGYAAWSRTSKIYIVYGTDGYIRHYNGSTLLVSNNVGNSTTTFYVDSSFYAVGATFGGISNLRVIKRAWNGTSYT